MTRLEAALRCMSRDLDELDVSWALIGGLALAAHGVEWPTTDIDIIVNLCGEHSAGTLADALRVRGHWVKYFSHEKPREVLVVLPRVEESGPLGVVDLLPCACGFEHEIVASANLRVVHHVQLPVASIGHLLACKLTAMQDRHRARDQRHLCALLSLATQVDREIARDVVMLSFGRGFLRASNPLSVIEPLCKSRTSLPGWTGHTLLNSQGVVRLASPANRGSLLGMTMSQNGTVKLSAVGS